MWFSSPRGSKSCSSKHCPLTATPNYGTSTVPSGTPHMLHPPSPASSMWFRSHVAASSALALPVITAAFSHLTRGKPSTSRADTMPSSGCTGTDAASDAAAADSAAPVSAAGACDCSSVNKAREEEGKQTDTTEVSVTSDINDSSGSRVTATAVASVGAVALSAVLAMGGGGSPVYNTSVGKAGSWRRHAHAVCFRTYFMLAKQCMKLFY